MASAVETPTLEILGLVAVFLEYLRLIINRALYWIALKSYRKTTMQQQKQNLTTYFGTARNIVRIFELFDVCCVWFFLLVELFFWMFKFLNRDQTTGPGTVVFFDILWFLVFSILGLLDLNLVVFPYDSYMCLSL